MRAPHKINASIANVLQQLGIFDRIKQYEILEIWPQIVGDQIARVATAEFIRNGKLFVKVEQSVWRNELLFLKKDIIQKLNKKMKKEIIKDIVFR